MERISREKGKGQEENMMKTLTREDFLKRRRCGIGGSDIAGIIGLSPWNTPRDIWYSKVGHDGEGNPIEVEQETPSQHWGTILENTIAEEYERVTGNKIFRCNQMFNAADCSGAGEKYFIANVDRLVSPHGTKKPVVRGQLRTDRILECKTTSLRNASMWGMGVKEDDNRIPEYYLCQIQWYMGVLGCKYADVAVLIGGNDFRTYSFERSDTLIEFLFDRAREFWETYVVPDVLPPASESDSACKAWPVASQGKEKYADKETLSLVKEYAKANAELNVLKGKMEVMKNKICDYMQDATRLINESGKSVCSWSAGSVRRAVNYKKMVEGLGITKEQLDAYTEESKSSRSFRLTAAAGGEEEESSGSGNSVPDIQEDLF